MKEHESFKLALEYLEIQKAYGPAIGFGNTTVDDAITAAEEALAQPEQEPIAKIEVTHRNGQVDSWRFVERPINAPAGTYYVYTTPPQRKPLTDEQRMIEMVDAAMVATASIYPPITRSLCETIIRAAAHGIKGDA